MQHENVFVCEGCSSLVYRAIVPDGGIESLQLCMVCYTLSDIEMKFWAGKLPTGYRINPDKAFSERVRVLAMMHDRIHQRVKDDAHG